MFKTIKRIMNWCGEFKIKLYIGFVFSFFPHGLQRCQSWWQLTP